MTGHLRDVDRARPNLWDHPAWATGIPSGTADRDGLLERRRRRQLPAKLRNCLDRTPSEAETSLVERGRFTATLLAVLSEWGYCTSPQIAEITGYRVTEIRETLYVMLAAGWVRHGQAGYHHDHWTAAEFWTIAETRDIGWLHERWDTRTCVEVFAGRPIGTLTKAAVHRARHDLFTLDLILGIAARSPNIATIAGPGSTMPARVLGIDDERPAIADALIVRDDGHLIFLEAGLAADGGTRRMKFYLDLANQRPAGTFTVAFVDIHHPHERRDRNQPERTLADVLDGELANRGYREFAFANIADWRDGTIWRERLPVRRPTSMKVDEFNTVNLTDLTDPAIPMPDWVPAHRQLAITPFLLRRPDDPPIRWEHWIDTTGAG